jgi:hypothetical protein
MFLLVATGIALLLVSWLTWHFGRRHQWRVLAAFLLAPAAPPLALSIWERNLDNLTLAAFFYPFAWMLGIPGYDHFAKRGWLQIWQVTLAGGVMGAAVALVFIRSGDLAFISKYAGFGALTGLVFWLIAFARLPSDNSGRRP